MVHLRPVLSARAALLVAPLLLALAPAASAAQTFDSGNIAPGASWSFTFTEPFPDGYTYHCHPHPWMIAMVHVMEDTDGVVEEVAVDILEPADAEAWGYSVEHLVVEVGDTVTWTNTGATFHTVTHSSDDHEHGDHAHGDHEHDGDGTAPSEGFGADATGLPILGVLAGIATVLVLRRRR